MPISIKNLRLNRFAAALALAVAWLIISPQRAAAQADVIRGRITGDGNTPISGASVSATSASGGVSRTATTDQAGRFTIAMANGDGDYWVQVTAIGYAARRMEIRRLADEEILIADVRMVRVGVALDPVKIRAPRQRVAADTGGTDVSGTETRLAADAATLEQLADLALLAATVPGVQIIPGSDGSPTGYSVFGLGADQNETTLNGMRFDATALPRDASFDASLATSPYDVSRGGFSGAQLALRTRPPTNLTLRANSVALDAPWLQLTDPAGRALGQDFGNVSIGGVVTSPIERDRAFMHVAYQASRRFSALSTLLNTDATGLRAAGLSADSVHRLLGIANEFGIPTSVGGLPHQRLSEQGLTYGSLTLLAPQGSNRSLELTFAGNWNRQMPAALSPTALPSHAGTRDFLQGSVQLRHTTYAGIVLSETQLGVGGSSSSGAPYLALPDATVRISSTFPDGDNTIGLAALGGSPALDRTQRSSNVTLMNQLSWFSLNNDHRLKLTTELSRDHLDERLAANTLGSFQFNSLTDLESGTPASFRRQLTAPSHNIANYVGGLALGDAYTPVDNLQLNYGVRADANYFGDTPSNNPLVASTFGIANNSAPDRIRFSPRLGFAYTPGTAHQVTAIQGAARNPGATIRGGIGVFQGLPGVSSLAAALDNTGLPGGVQQLLCVGPAAPRPDWTAYRTNISNVPGTCADGSVGTVFSSAQPNVTLFAHDYSAPRSVRSNLQWASQILGDRFNARAEATYSLNLDQPGSVDLNFRPDQRFALGDENNRPVYVQSGSIVPQTGALSSNDARQFDQFAQVTELRSDLKSEAKQLTLSLSPTGFHSGLSWSLAYAYSQIRDETYGFASAGGDPRQREWARSSFDSRHQFVYSIGYDLFDLFRLSWAGSLRSGAPFTPQVSGDINGDGVSNDRAFVFSPSGAQDPQLASALGALVDSGPKSARDCLRAQEGRVAGRNSCEGPWASAASLTIGLNPVRWWRSNRLDVQFQVSNPLGAADLLANGANHLRGWGQTPLPDATLLYVRGFDPTANRFLYQVNPRFGSTAPSQSTIRAPVIFTAVVRFDVGPTRERQMLTQQLDAGRRTRGNKMPEAVLKGFYSTGGVFNPIGAVLRVADSLSLTGSQADSLTILNSVYTRRLDVIWAPIAKQLAALPANYDAGDAYAIYVRGRRQTIDLLTELAPSVRGLLTSAQVRLLPTYLLAHLDPRYLATIRSGTAGLGLAYLPGVSAPRSSGGGTGSVVSSP